MKIKFLQLVLVLLTVSIAHCQNAIAELKFEEAEVAFNSGNYDLTIQKVDEFEQHLGNMTDKSLYLRVISQNRLLKLADIYKDEKQFAMYQTLLNNSSKYIKATENKELNDKFREVYAIKENLSKLNLPKDKNSWAKEKLRMETEAQAAVEEAKKLEVLRKEVAPKIDSWQWQDYIATAADFSDLKKKYPEVYKKLWKNKYKSKVKSRFYTSYSYINVWYSGLSNVFDKLLVNENGIITNYSMFLGKFAKETEVREFVDRELGKLKATFGGYAIRKFTEKGQKNLHNEHQDIESVFESGFGSFLDEKDYYFVESAYAKSNIVLIVEKYTMGFWIVRGEKNLTNQ